MTMRVQRFTVARAIEHPITKKYAKWIEVDVGLSLALSMCNGAPVGIEMATKERTRLVPMSNVDQIDFVHAHEPKPPLIHDPLPGDVPPPEISKPALVPKKRR